MNISDEAVKIKYAEFINELWPNLNLSKDEVFRNNITDAIASENNFIFFKEQMKKRLKRLNIKFADNPNIIDTVRNLHSMNNWGGALCELIAYDLLSSLGHEVELQKKLEINDTLAKYIPNKGASYIDAYIHNYRSNFEIKGFNDNLKIIIDNLNNSFNQFITCDYDYFVDSKNISANYNALKKELSENISKNTKDFHFRSKVCDELNFHVYYTKPQISSTIHCGGPYQEAEKLEKLPLDKYHQFSINTPNFKIFVIHPWLNNTCINKISRPDILFRSLSRRVFCKLTKDNKIFDNKSGLTTQEIAKKITALMFIIDNSVEPSEDYNSNDELSIFSVYLFWNPNVENKNKIIGFKEIEQDLNLLNGNVLKLLDDFQGDNY